VWEKGVPLPPGYGVWGGGCAPPQKGFGFFDIKWWVFVHSGSIIYRLNVCFTHKNGAFGLIKRFKINTYLWK